MRFRPIRLLASALALAFAAAIPAVAQSDCHAWDATFAAPGPDGGFSDFVEFDDGAGLALYACGPMRSIGTRDVLGVARWDGVQWNQVGGGLRGASQLAVFDDGGGAKLYAAGTFTVAAGDPADSFARWNGTSWEPLAGAGGPTGALAQVHALEVFDDGTGPALYAAGQIWMPGGSQRVVRWNGSAWSSISTGIPITEYGSSLAVYDGGTGPALFVGMGSGSADASVRRWNGASWIASVPSGTPAGSVQSMVKFGAPGTTHLYVAGRFQTPTGGYAALARFDGTTWTLVDGLASANAFSTIGHALAVHDDGSGARLWIAGYFETAGGQPADGLATWDGTSWTVISPGFRPLITWRVRALASFDDGAGRALFVGGFFGRIGRVVAANAARLRAGSWSGFADGGGVGAQVRGMQAIDLGAGPAIYASGQFEAAGTTIAKGIARFDGTSWLALGDPLGTDGVVLTMAGFDAGAGLELYAGGSFTRIGGVTASNIARWDGVAWHSLGSGLSYGPGLSAEAMAVFDDGSGPALYVGGQFSTADGVLASCVARWNGTSFSPLGQGTNFLVRDLAVHDDGSGAALYACGLFTMAGGIAVPRLARWDGTSWSAVGSSTLVGAGQLFDLQVFDDGGGAKLYLSGTAGLANPNVNASIARWDGTAWTAVSLVSDFAAEALSVVHDGIAPRLCTPRRMSSPNGTTNSIATWDGTQWGALPGEVEGNVGELQSADLDANGVPELYVGGSIHRAGGEPAWNLARFVTCGTRGQIVCAGDGSPVPCPCGNSGAPGHGCANSQHASGARLELRGLASLGADTLVLDVTSVTGSAAIFAQGTSVAGVDGVPFDDGLRCVGGTVRRLGSAPIAGAASSFPQPGGARLAQLGFVTLPGETRVYQAVYRNAASFCTSGSANATNGIRVTWSL